MWTNTAGLYIYIILNYYNINYITNFIWNAVAIQLVVHSVDRGPCLSPQQLYYRRALAPLCKTTLIYHIRKAYLFPSV